MAVLCTKCGKKKSFLFGDGFKALDGRMYCRVCFENEKRNCFCEKIKPYIDAGLAVEFYYNQHFSVCNFANWAYGIVFYSETPYEVAFLTPEQVDHVNMEMYNAVSTVNGMRHRKEHAFSLLSDELFSKLQERKKETDKNGPSQHIDPKLEAYWSERRGEMIKEFELPPMDIN